MENFRLHGTMIFHHAHFPLEALVQWTARRHLGPTPGNLWIVQ